MIWSPLGSARHLARWARGEYRATLGEILRPDLPMGPDGDPHDLPIGWVDRRAKQKPDRGRPHGIRPWQQITGLTLHQTATPHLTYGHPGLLAIPAHAVILRDGTVVLLHALQEYLWHGHNLNASTIGVEIVCRAAGIEGDMRTVWMSRREKKAGKKPEDVVVEATDAQLGAAQMFCNWAMDVVEQNGGEITEMWAHRQGHRSRVSDTGSRIWKGVGLKVAQRWGLQAHPARKLGSGKRIPDAWSGQDLGIRYNWRVK